MIHLTRRRLLAGTAALPLPLMLGGCPAGTTLTPAQVVSYAQTAVSGLAGAFKALVAADPALVPTATATAIVGYLNDAQVVAGGLSANLTAPAGATVVQQIDTDLNAVLNALAAPPINGLIPAPFNEAIAAVAIVAPTLDAFVNQYLPAAPVAAASLARAKVAALAPAMTVPQAVAVLQGYAGK